MNEIDKKTFEPVKSEMYQLLLCAYSYERKMKSLGDRLKTESRAFLLEEVTALRHLSNGIILHLCNLDDDSAKWSLRSLRKSLAKTSHDQQALNNSNELLKGFRTALNKFKTKHRNDFIAHRNAVEYPDPFYLPDYRKDFRDIVQLALKAFESLWGAKVQFGFRLGSRDRTLNFKDELGLT